VKKTFNIQPLKQGDLDGLCGVYAVFNAVRCVSQSDPMSIEEDYDKSCEIFSWPFVEKIVTIDTVVNGSDVDVIIKLLTLLQDRLKSFKFKQIKRKFDIFKLLDKGPVIVGFEGMDNHWTVISGYDDKYFYLFDSTYYHKFLIKDVILDTDEVVSDKICIPRLNIISILPH
jgi:hypothetical protein